MHFSINLINWIFTDKKTDSINMPVLNNVTKNETTKKWKKKQFANENALINETFSWNFFFLRKLSKVWFKKEKCI